MIWTVLLITGIAVLGYGQNSVVISEEFTWQYQSVAEHRCQTFKHTFAGPGVVTVRTKMRPFQSRDLGMSKEDIVTHSLGYFASSMGQTINGDKNADIKDFQGRPVDRISKWKIDGKKYDAEFKVCNPVKCNLAGDCSQYQAAASLVVDFTASAAEPPSASMVTASANITGTWVIVSGGKAIDRLDISELGDGYKVEARAGDDAPLLWSGFGIVQGDRLIVATRNVSTGVSGLVVITLSGDRVHYRSYYLDGRKAWDGYYDRRK